MSSVFSFNMSKNLKIPVLPGIFLIEVEPSNRIGGE